MKLTQSPRPSPLLVATAILALLLCTSLSARADAAGTPPARIPEVHVLSFSGDRVDLPAMLVGKVAILVLGFSKGAREQATLWGRRLPTDYINSTDVLYFEMPVLESVPRLLRGAVLHAIKNDVSPRSQPHFAPLTSDEQRWRSLAHYNRPDDAYVLLVDSTGTIRARFQGAPTDASYTDLRRSVDQIRPTPTQ